MEEFELEPGEEIILTVRQHILVLFFRLLFFPVLALLPLVLLSIANFVLGMAPELSAHAGAGASLANPIVRFALGVWWLFVWMALFSTLTRYYLTQWVITSTRIVDINQYGFFNRGVSSFLLIRVQDITTGVYGIFGTIFGFGTLNVETAGRDEKFVMYGLRDPEGVRDIIMREVAVLHADGTSDS